MTSRLRDDEGRLSILILGLAVIATTLILGGLAVTSVHISRMRLLDAADAAALDATDEAVTRVYSGGVGQALPLSDEVVQQTAVETLAGRQRPQGLNSWAVAGGTGSPDGQTAVIRLTGEADLPLVGGLIRGLGGSVTVGVESQARADTLIAP